MCLWGQFLNFPYFKWKVLQYCVYEKVFAQCKVFYISLPASHLKKHALCHEQLHSKCLDKGQQLKHKKEETLLGYHQLSTFNYNCDNHYRCIIHHSTFCYFDDAKCTSCTFPGHILRYNCLKVLSIFHDILYIKFCVVFTIVFQNWSHKDELRLS